MFKKQYVKSRNIYKVIFEVPTNQLPKGMEVNSVHLVGDFNSWDNNATPMKKLKSGTFKTTVEFKDGGEYQFRYLINGETWFNDWAADRYQRNEHGEDNCVISLPPQ
jgi:1,4-alpha-glucan branching enzyme